MERLVAQPDATFISHPHGDHANQEVARLFLAKGKPVVAPEGLWSDNSEFASKLTYPKRAVDVVHNLTVQGGRQSLKVVAFPGHQGATVLNNIHLVTSPEGFTVVQTGDQWNEDKPGTDFAWISQIGQRHKVDVLMPNCGTRGIERIVQGINPKVVITGHENEMGHTVDHREDFTQTYTRLWDAPQPTVLMTWAFPQADYDVVQYESDPRQKEKRRWILAGKFPVHQDQSAEARNTALAIDWLSRRDASKPFFLRLSFNAPHTPAVSPAQYLPMIDSGKIHLPFPTDADLAGLPKRESVLLRGFQGTQRLTRDQLRKARHCYYARVAFADAMMGRLIDWMKQRRLLDNTIVAFVSDHGSHLGDHGMLQKQTFYEQVGTVPYFFWRSGLGKPGTRLKTPVNILGLLPTLLELAGLPRNGVDGQSLAAQVSRGVEPQTRPLFSEIAFGYQGYRDADRQVMVRDGQHKLSLFPDTGDPDAALYNLAADPGESRNMFNDPKQRDLIVKLREKIREWDRSRHRTV